MFGFLKKKLSESVERLSEKVKKKEGGVQLERPVVEAKKPERHRPPKVKKGLKPEEKKPTFKERVVGKVLERRISEKDIDSLFEEIELDLMEANVALETMDFLKRRMKEYLVGKQLKRGEIKKEIRNTLEKILFEIFDQEKIDLEKLAKTKKPVCIVFLGFNGSGKTTSIAKIGKYLKNRGFKVVLAAGDTFRAASIEQLEFHGERLGLKVIKHKYGADSAAVIYDAKEHAKAKGVDFVLADTAGRTHANRDLMDELKKVVRVNSPDLKILVMDSLTGNDLVEQATKFDEAIGVDAIIFTKVDVNEKGGGMLSACHAIKKPILYIGLGQEYDDIEIFDAKKFVKDLLGE